MSELSPRVKALIEAHVPAPLRPYITQMIRKESRGNSNTKSSTGASGLLQFTKGTGSLYGLVGSGFDRRTDDEANIKAGVRLTLDNQAALRQKLGREPTFSDLAVAHQQGAGTAAKMLLGQGNATPNALAVNNVSPNASPQAAAKAIQDYYGFGANLGPPGMGLAYNPWLPQPQHSPATVGTPTTDTTATPATAAAPAEQDWKQKLFGADGKGGKDTPFATITDALGGIAKGFSGKVDPAVAVEQAKIGPSSAALLETGGGASAAAALLSSLMAAKRKNYGLTLNSGVPNAIPI